MTIARLEHAEELLDEQRHDMAELEQSLGHVASVNRWLGGTRAILTQLAPFFEHRRNFRLLDVATGSADIPLAIAKRARKAGLSVEVVATDVHPQMLEISRKRCRDFPEITVESADALKLSYADDTFDASTLSMALHHFEGEDQVRVLRELKRVTKERVIVNDLERTRLNYLGAKLLSFTLWHGNRLTRHDGPLSVLRAFTPRELLALARRAGMNAKVERMFFQRVVLVGDASSAATSTELR